MVTYTDAQMVDDLAQQLFVSLTADAPTPPTINFSDPRYSFTPDPTSDLYKDAKEISLTDLTQVDLAGEGVFDKLMASVDLHIQREFRGNRITGDQYAKVYTEAMTGVLGSSVQFLLAKDQARWTAITAQMQARIAEIQATKALIELEEAKFMAQKLLFDMQNSGAQYALTKMQIAGENQKHFLIKAQTDTEVYQVEHLLPAETAIKTFINQELQPIEKQTAAYQINVALPVKTDIEIFQRDSLLPTQLGQEQHKLNQLMPAQTSYVKEQVESQRAQTLNTRTDSLTPISGILGKQRENLENQIALLIEQKEAERSKTLNTRTDGTTIVGSVGKQKDLYTQQIDSFIKDAKFKTAKMYLDGWITQKTLDEALTAPSELTNIEINEVLVANRTANGL